MRQSENLKIKQTLSVSFSGFQVFRFSNCFFLLFLLQNICSAQEDFFDKHYLTEERRYLQSPQAQESQNDFNIIYDRCEWQVDPAVNYIQGKVTTYFKVVAASLDTLSFDLTSSLTVDSVLIHNVPISFSHSSEQLTVFLPATLNQNSIDSVSIFYHGVPAGSGSGFGSFVQKSHSGTPIIWTLSEPYGAKDWWPCKNGLGDKIDSIDVLVTCPSQYRAASNGLLVSENLNGSNKTYHWKHRYPIATYLVCMAVTNYAAYSNYVPFGNDTLQILNYVYPEDSAAAASQTPALIPVMQLYDTLFGLYPFAKEKYGMAEFGWGGGMEHQTMTFICCFTFDIMAHELAHHWFGDKVTLGSWQDLWLNEGFAVFCELYVHKRLDPNLATWQGELKSDLTGAVSIADGTVHCPVADTLDVNRLFKSQLTYSKGAVVLNQLRWVLGDSAFFAGIRSYLADSTLAYSFARTADLQRHFEMASSLQNSPFGQNLDWYFNDWFYGGGYPEYDIAWKQYGDTVAFHVNQQQSDPSVSYFTLPLPLELKGRGGHDTMVVLNNTFNGQIFYLPIPFKVDSVFFDPDLNLVTANNYIHDYVGEVSPEDGLSVFPTPVNDELTIYTAALNGKINLSMYNELGELMIEKETYAGPNTDAVTLDVSNLSKGCYYIRVIAGDRVINRKVLIAR